MNSTFDMARVLAAAAVTLLCGTSIACNTSPQAKEAKYLRRGEAFFEQKDYPRALLEFKNASEAMPKDAEPYYQMGVAALAAGNLSDGIGCLRKATELNPEHQRAQLKLAELMTASSNQEILQQAASRLEAILSASPDNSEANDALALAEWKLGKTEEAVIRLEDTLRKFPSQLQSSMALARLKLAQQDFAAAEQVLQQAVASAPKSSAAQQALGELYMIANQPQKAEGELRKALQLDSKNGAALMGLAAIQVSGNRMQEAEQTYRQLSSLPNGRFKPLHALFLYKSGKREEALAEFEKLSRDDPNDRGARSRLFAAYVALGKDQAAKDLIAAALKKNPRDSDALFHRASLSLRAGDLPAAEKDLKEVLRFTPDFAEGHVALAAVYRAQNLKSTERQELNEALRINPAFLGTRLGLARSFTAANDAKSALNMLNSAPQSQKSSLAFVIERNWALLAAGEKAQLRPILDQALHIRHVPELLIQDALLRFEQGDFPGARADAEEVIQTNPEDVRALRLLADSYQALKQPAKAEERLKATVAAHPQSAPLANLLGEWYRNTGNLSAARKAFEKAQALDPKSLDADLALAAIDHREKSLDAARQRLVKLAAEHPGNVTVLLMQAEWAGEAGDQDEAIAHYRAVIAADGSNVEGLNNLAYALAFRNPDEALKYAQRAAEIAPGNLMIADTLGCIYYKKAIYRTAIDYLEAAVAKQPTPQLQFHLAMSYLKSGRREIGEKTLQLALRQDPNLYATEKDW